MVRKFSAAQRGAGFRTIELLVGITNIRVDFQRIVGLICSVALQLPRRPTIRSNENSPVSGPSKLVPAPVEFRSAPR